MAVATDFRRWRRSGAGAAVLLLSWMGVATASSRASPASMGLSPGQEPSMAKAMSSALAKAREEQACEDYNALKRAESIYERRYLVMPMSDELDPPAGHPGHGRLQYSDRIMIPTSLARDIFINKLEYPWQFELAPIDGGPLPLATSRCKKLFCGVVIQRVSPENFVFLPKWMMRALGLKPRDVITLRHLKLPAASLVKFRPVKRMHLSHPRAVFENELKHYSTVTEGSTVSFKYNDREYEMKVEGVKAGRQGVVDGASIEDTDVSTELLESFEEIAEKKRKAEREARAAARAAKQARAKAKGSKKDEESDE